MERWIDLVADEFIVGWRGAEDIDGGQLPYTKRAAIDLLNEEPKLIVWIGETVSNSELFIVGGTQSGGKDSPNMA